MSKEELKVCPFCGGEAMEVRIFGRLGIECQQCSIHIRSREICVEVGYDSIYAAWNTRQPDTELEKAYGYASRLFKTLAPQCDLHEDLMGVLTQIDNWCSRPHKQNTELVAAMEKIIGLAKRGNAGIIDTATEALSKAKGE